MDGPLMRAMDWMTRLLYLQLLWVVFSLLGLIVGGLFPATFTVFGITRKWIREGDGFRVFSTFKEMYKESFFKANILGWWIVAFGVSLYYYFNLTNQLGGVMAILSIAILITVSLIVLVTSVFIIPVYVHYDVRLLQVIKHAIAIAITHPLHVVSLLLTLIAFYYLFLFIPGIFILFGMSSLATVFMYIANRAFTNVEKKLST